MNCTDYEMLISACADGELAGKEEADLMAHLSRCQSCAAIYEQTVRLQNSLAEALLECPGTPDLVSAVTAAIRPKPKARSVWLWAAAAVLALVAICSQLLFAPPRHTGRAHRDSSGIIAERSRIERAPAPQPQVFVPEPRPREYHPQSTPGNIAKTPPMKRLPKAAPVVKRTTPVPGPSPVAVDEAEVTVQYLDSKSAAASLAGVPKVTGARLAADHGDQVATETEVTTADGKHVRQMCYRTPETTGTRKADDEASGGQNANK